MVAATNVLMGWLWVWIVTISSVSNICPVPWNPCRIPAFSVCWRHRGGGMLWLAPCPRKYARIRSRLCVSSATSDKRTLGSGLTTSTIGALPSFSSAVQLMTSYGLCCGRYFQKVLSRCGVLPHHELVELSRPYQNDTVPTSEKCVASTLVDVSIDIYLVVPCIHIPVLYTRGSTAAPRRA